MANRFLIGTGRLKNNKTVPKTFKLDRMKIGKPNESPASRFTKVALITSGEVIISSKTKFPANQPKQDRSYSGSILRLIHIQLA